MNRNPPLNVIKKLRQEVNFTCPIPGCTNPILTWHHFDPPWHIKNHHNPDGMIALCSEHHRLADGGNWTIEDLRKFKTQPQNMNLIKRNFLWCEAKVLYRMGGNYAANCPYILTISGEPIVWHTVSPEKKILFSFDFRDRQGRQVLLIEENSMIAQIDNLHDISINTFENHLKVWIENRRIGLELRLHHLSLEELKAKLEKDAKIAYDKIKESLPILPFDMIPNPIIPFALDYAKKECLNSDGKVVVMDIINSTLYGGGKCIKIKDGIISGSEFLFNFSLDNGAAAFAF